MLVFTSIKPMFMAELNQQLALIIQLICTHTSWWPLQLVRCS